MGSAFPDRQKNIDLPFWLDNGILIANFQSDILVIPIYIIYRFYCYKSEILKQKPLHKILVAMGTD